MKSKIILDIEENDVNLFKKQYINLADIKEEIERLEDDMEKLDKRKKEYRLAKDKINFLIDMYNIKAGWKVFKSIK
jgi:prefoldin subunit 5